MNHDDQTPEHSAPDLWALARADYLAGGSATEVCERHGLSVSTLRWRARNEGWRRTDFCESPIDTPFAAPDDDGKEEDDIDWNGKAPASDLAISAWLHAQTAIRRGRMIEARGWVRLHRDLSDAARREAAAARYAASPAVEKASAAIQARIDARVQALADEAAR
jgi:hypothetical protein